MFSPINSNRRGSLEEYEVAHGSMNVFERSLSSYKAYSKAGEPEVTSDEGYETNESPTSDKFRTTTGQLDDSGVEPSCTDLTSAILQPNIFNFRPNIRRFFHPRISVSHRIIYYALPLAVGLPLFYFLRSPEDLSASFKM